MTAEPSSAYKIVAYGQRPYRLGVGIALSLVVHALLLFVWRHSLLQPRPADAVPAVRSIAVWLRPPEARPPEPEPVPKAVPNQPAARQARAARRPARSTELIAIPKAAPEAPVPPDAFTVEQPAPAAPRFDPEAAKKTARQIASEPDPARADTAVGQIAPKALATETKAARAIASAKRRDCKDGIPGGLLAPLYLMMDKKDSGCKW